MYKKYKEVWDKREGDESTIETKTKTLGSAPSSPEEYYWNNLELALVDAVRVFHPAVEDTQQNDWITG